MMTATNTAGVQALIAERMGSSSGGISDKQWILFGHAPGGSRE
jgi:hypothetical protein